jgi:hypothetical protein
MITQVNPIIFKKILTRVKGKNSTKQRIQGHPWAKTYRAENKNMRYESEYIIFF